MSTSRIPSKLSNKLRSMPRRKTPSAVYIELHQLANERERLQVELKRLSDRTNEVHKRLQQLEINQAQLEIEAIQYNSNPESVPNSPLAPSYQNPQPQSLSYQNKKYQNFVIEY